MADKPAHPKSGDTTTSAAAAAATQAAASGGLKAWLPLILTLVFMPALALVMTKFVLLPKLTIVLGREPGAAAEDYASDHPQTTQGGSESGGGEHGGSGAPSSASHASKYKEKFPLSKLVVNVSGSLGTRLLLCSVTLTGNDPSFRAVIEENADMLKDLASSVLASKSISDLEKPEARNLLRSELMSQFNGSLGKNLIQDIYITEMAIQ